MMLLNIEDLNNSLKLCIKGFITSFCKNYFFKKIGN